MAGQKRKREALLIAARNLVATPDFLHRVGDAIGRLGVVGEERNRLVVFLAGITKELDEPVSLIVKGASSSGKSNLLRTALRLFPADAVIERTSLSSKAPAYTDLTLEKIILFLQEYRGGKDAQLLIRLLQSEGKITHEATTVAGKNSGTKVMRQKGMPVVMTTTTADQIFEDDATRFLAVHVDQSAQQTLAIAKARVQRSYEPMVPRLRVWQRAVGLITRKEGDFQNPPRWLEYVAEHLPLDQVRVRRDWARFLALCQAIALCRRGSGEEPANIRFADYIVAYKIFEPALAATARAMHPREVQLVGAVEKLSGGSRHGVTPKAIADLLGWERPLVYKYLEMAAEHQSLEYESGTHERNQKFVVPARVAHGGFLPSPRVVLEHVAELPNVIKFIDPFMGKRKVLKRA